jgi:hypothetical protein
VALLSRAKPAHRDPNLLAPPEPSAHYRRDPRYAAHGSLDLDGNALRRATANHRQWQARWAGLTAEVQDWCAREGLFGADAQAARVALDTATRLKAEAQARLEAARHRVTDERRHISEATARAVAGKSDLPTGTEAVAAESAVRAAELVAAEIGPVANACLQRWGRQVQRADWRQALEKAQLMDSPEAQEAAVWLRAKLRPPLSASVDPAAWW